MSTALKPSPLAATVRLLGALLLAVPLVACGGAETPDSATATPEAEAAAPAESPSASEAAIDGDACSALTAAELAAIVGADEGAVTQQEPPVADLPPAIDQCAYTAKHDGLETTVTLYTRPGMNDSETLAGYLANGEKIGSRTYVYEQATLGGVE
ncbi:MAG: hypothetical protein AAF725_24545, partial [Acidobacteriota bacterium]